MSTPSNLLRPFFSECFCNSCFPSCKICERSERQHVGVEGQRHHPQPGKEHRLCVTYSFTLYDNLVVFSLQASANNKVAHHRRNNSQWLYLLNIICLEWHHTIWSSFENVPCECIDCYTYQKHSVRLFSISALLESCILQWSELFWKHPDLPVLLWQAWFCLFIVSI